MKKRTFLNFVFYALPLAAILTWWTLAFKQHSESKPPLQLQKQKEKKFSPIVKYLSPLVREKLHSALSGNYTQMIALITDWDHDAQMMEQWGFQDIQRLTKNDFLRCQLLARQINNSSPEELQRLHECSQVAYVQDDNKNLFDLGKSYKRFLPQSYVAASFLLALTEPDSIVALPKGLRDQKNIYPTKITRLISLDSDRYNSEKLYETRPEIAFVADYSQPSTIQALGRQNIPLFTLKHVNSPEEICDALIRIGHVIGRSLEAELLNYFIEAAMQAINNRFKILNAAFNTNKSQPKVLFLRHYMTFSTPTSNTLTGKLLKRMGIDTIIGDEIAQNKSAWMIPIHQEQILEIDPDYIIIGANSMDASRNNILKDPVFNMLSNKQKNQIRFVDDAIQESPSQYMVLAYYDLFSALCR